MTIRADGAAEWMSARSVASLPGSVALMLASAEAMSLSQVLVDERMQVSMMEEKPASLPPIVKLTSVVEELSDESWLLMTSATLAPEHAANVKDVTELAAAHSAG